MNRIVRLFGSLLLALLVVTQSAARPPASAAPAAGFVTRSGAELRLNGQRFRFAGSNNYYLMYKSQVMVDNVLEAAAANGFTVMRIWGSLDIGNQDGSNSIRGKADGVYFQYWNGTNPAYNDGDDGLKRLDYVIARAGELGIKLVIPFVNNWNDFGGMDQYVRWRGGQYHDQFYTDPVIRGWYKDWIAHLINRTNSITGIQYKNDPTIMTWELGNEPRCLSAGAYPRSPTCTAQTLVDWAGDVSGFIKSIDPNHLVSVGDEGFYCVPGSNDWTENCNEGVDTIAFTQLPNIDVMSFHLYPDGWGKDIEWTQQWIARHVRDAKANNKASMLGEFGLHDKSIRNPVYQQWTNIVYRRGGDGALYWILSDKQDDGSYYADYDGFTVYCPSPVCITISNFAKMMGGQAPTFAPVADHDTAVTEFATPVTLDPLPNDITYGSAHLAPTTIDLDPATAGQQLTRSTYGGTFAVQSGATVSFTPDEGFAGKAQIAYTIRDSLARLSNPANLVVTVKPDPTGMLTLFSFETGTEGWAPGSWQGNAGTVAQSADFHTDGSYSLQVNAADGGWFGYETAEVTNLTGKTHLKYDLQTVGAGSSINAALKLGDSWTWCQGTWGWSNPGTTTTVDIDLLSLACEGGGDPDLSKLHGIYIWISGGGTFYIDNIRAE